ncbi:hypothetical protein FHR83_006661 [Actinoplanes campanulatus]|uniref:Uncharacterized protein n=1 Tax=Actinoplanes campanulatus TaxID=113559 RepID=A0A7W5AMP3_9ACTN|nr:hypothetical protein [Actinoplanes campanulatus]MBB3098955.1 hypothetical protein [Actinoplanes campanulatus]GGN39698.1 hypothetical protein GCM10010109_67950 [Actinoplanes campanulatus]
MTRSKLPPRRPQSERKHWIFLDQCGCPIGLVEESRFYKTEDAAWDGMYDTRAEERAARARGVHTVFVDHATYEERFYPRMTKRCTHEDAA